MQSLHHVPGPPGHHERADHYHIPTRRPMTVYFAISSRTLREKSAPPRKSGSGPVDATLSRVPVPSAILLWHPTNAR